MTNQRTLAGAVVVLIGLIAVVVGIIYLTVEAKSLPSVLGQLHGVTGHRSKRGIGALVVGVVLLAAGGGMLAFRPRRLS
jgi:hypothetical protein